MRYLNFKSSLAFVLSISALSTYCDNKSGMNGVKGSEPLLYIILHCLPCLGRCFLSINPSKIIWTPALVFLTVGYET